jgi:peptidoglycan hydrolase CwlO-like protein
MVDYEPIQSDIQEVTIPPTDSNDSLSFTNSIKALGKAWSGSIVVKILSLITIAIIVLFIVFTALTTGYAATKASCDSNLTEERTRHDQCKNRVNGLDADKRDKENQLIKEVEQIRVLEKDNERLSKSIEYLKGNKTEKERKIKELKEQHNSLENKENDLKKEVSYLQEQKKNKDTELEKANTDLTKHKQDLTQKKKIRQYYLIGGGGEALIDLVSFGLTGYYRYNINKIEDESNAAELKNRELQGQLKNMQGRTEDLRCDIKRIDGQISQTHENINKCHNDIAIVKAERDLCIEQETKLHNTAKVLVELGIDQVVYHLLNVKNRTEIRTTMLYNSTKNGFVIAEIGKFLGGNKHTLWVMHSNTGFVFGVLLNVPWDDNDSHFKTDAHAFTFSTTRHHVCPIKDETKAVKYGGIKIMDIGDGEIQIDPSDSTATSVHVNAGRNFNCGNVSPDKFYSETGSFDIIEMSAYSFDIFHPDTNN